MELLTQYKQSGFYTSTLYLLMAHKKMVPENTPIIPSEYLKNMNMSTTERLQNLQGIDIPNIVSPDPSKPKKPVLEFSPRILVFQNFKVNDKIVTKFSVKNISNGPTFLNMVFKQNTYFSIKPYGSELLSRLAPGIKVSFVVTFMPVVYEDLAHQINFYTDVDHYIVPLIAMAPRCIINFPDSVVVPPTPLKIESNALMTVHNVGENTAGFTLKTNSPFSVYPKYLYLQPKITADIKVAFKTMYIGEREGELIAKFETGENFHIKLKGTTHTVSIELEKAVVRFLDTYNTMVRQQVYKMTNRSDELITYMCMKNESVFEDFMEKVKLAEIFYELKESETAKNMKLVHYDVLSSDEHERVYTRIFFDEVHSLVADESLQFQDHHFSISPISGSIWPRKTTELTVTFAPKEIGDFKAVSYLDIDGIADRVPLTLQGTSLPPYITLNVESLDMDNVYINKTYRYQIVAINKGHIYGVIQYRECPPLFGSVITCTPEIQCLPPGEKAVFVVSFLNSNQGPYFEELDFVIRDTNIVRKLYLKGTIIYPTLIFGVPCLEFGDVSVGVPKTLQVEVINESGVNIRARVLISSDGPEESARTLDDCDACGLQQMELPRWPREFDIQPSKVELDANSKTMIQVTLTANLVRANHTFLELELDKSDSPPITLPLSFSGKVPDVQSAPDINLRACFLDNTYKCDIVVATNEYWGYFSILPPEPDDTLIVDLDVTRGIIKPNSTICLPCSITANVLGKQEYTIRMQLFGDSRIIHICHITANAVRPIVTCNPTSMNWGHVALLAKHHRTLTLNNDSPVIVYFKAYVINKDNRFEIEPAEGYVNAEGETELTMSVHLIDADTYVNKAVIRLEKIKDIIVPLSAVGVGTSITIGPGRNHVNLGRHFCKLPLQYSVTMTNCGTKLHNLEWLEHFKQPRNKVFAPLFFDLKPRNFKLSGGEKMDLIISGSPAKPTAIKETWYLVGNVEGGNKKELLMECAITGEFVDPRIEMHPAQIDLRYDYGPYSEFYALTSTLSIKNISKLPLHLDINIKPPFAIIHRAETYKVDTSEPDLCDCIRYNEHDLNTQNLLALMGPYESKLFIDCMTKKPIQRTRRGPLNFFQDINKIKMAFNLTNSVQESLEDQETIKLQILFDTTKHTNNKSKIYSDLMRVKFKGHKNKDAVRIVGKVNFPNIVILTPKIDFQCILNGSIESRIIKIHNPTNLLVCFSFIWKKCTASTTKVPELPKIEYETTTYEGSSTISDIRDSVKDIGELVIKKPNLSRDESFTMQRPVEAGDAPLEVGADSSEGGVDMHVVSDVIEPTDSRIQFQLKKKRILQKIMPMLKMDRDRGFPWAHKFPKAQQQELTYNINDIFVLVPYQGRIKPGETQDVHIVFMPTRNICIRALLECTVLGGPTELITVAGQSSNMLFRLSTQTINFKIRSYHEDATENLYIKNLVQLPIEYIVYLNEPVFENELPATIREVIPPEKIIGPEEEATITIAMRPGVLGYFTRKFLLEIGHMPHISIEVFGWGVIPQVYLTLPRLGMNKFDIVLEYSAIAMLTPEYMAAVSEFFTRNTAEHLNSPQKDKCMDDPDFREDWHICSPWDGYPSVMDVELALERLLVVRHLNARPDMMTVKGSPIHGFSTLPYLVDFGVMITDTSVTCSIHVVNYGPIPVKMHFAKSYSARHWLVIKMCGKLEPGESGKIDMTFFPQSHDFPACEQIFDRTFNIEVPYGVSIPINVRSLIAVPFLKCNVPLVDFGSVRCGDKVIVCVPLKNVGKPTCVWYATLKMRTPGPSPMVILDGSGKYEPGEGGWLSITFKPTMQMTYEGLLIFRFHMNPTKMVIPIIGHGVFPHVHIIGPNMSFPPTLPWSDVSEIFFGITNPCPFPIELIVAHVDTLWKEEEEIYQLLNKYYNKPEELLLPAIQPGAGMPPEVRNFFTRFKSNVANAIEQEALSAVRATSARSGASKKEKSPRKGQKVKEKEEKEVTERKIRTESEIIADEIKSMKEKGFNPLAEAIDARDSKKGAGNDKTSKGLLLFLYGSPGEEVQCLRLAYTLGMKLSLPVINFDNTFIDALCVCECLAKVIIMNALDDNFEAMKKVAQAKEDNNSNGSENMHDPPGFRFDEYDDDFEIVKKKLMMFAMNKKASTTRTKSEKLSKQQQKGHSSTAISSINNWGSATLFSQELTEELLTDYLSQDKFNRGFILDSLTSAILRNPTSVLMTMLVSKKSIKNIHLILCQSNFTKWAQTFEESQRAEELLEEEINKITVYTPEEIQKIIQDIDEMDADEYEHADPELKEIYIQNSLHERKMKYIEKYGQMPQSQHITFGDPKKEKSVARDVNPLEAESKKKIKREGGQTKSEFNAMQTRYSEYYRSVYESLVHMACNWNPVTSEIEYPAVSLAGQLLLPTAKKSKKKSENFMTQSEPDLSERGFPLTLINCPCANYEIAIANMFLKCEYYASKLKIEDDFDILACPLKRKEYTVLLPKSLPVIQEVVPLQWRFLAEKPIRKCECNEITDLNLLDDTTQDNVLNILSKWHCVCGKKMVSSQTSTTDVPSGYYDKSFELSVEGEETQPLPLRAVHSIKEPVNRLILQPGDLVRCKYAFKPTVEGHFSVKRFVEVTGWPDSRTDITVTGICDLPRIDSRPKKLFANFVRKTEEDQVYKLTFLDDLKMFEFGPIFIGYNRIYEEEYTIDLRNASLLTCDINIDFMSSSDVFIIDKKFITLEPGAREKLMVSAAPTVTGDHESLLLFCIKDNPEIVKIKIMCHGVVPLVEVLPITKHIDYGKLLLYRREDDRFIVKNDSILPIKWVVRNPEDFREDFILSKVFGIVPRNDNQVVPVTFTACNVKIHSQIPLIIDIYDELGRGSPMLVDTIYFSAECYDVMVECAFENPNEMFLNFGNVKVNSTVYRDMYFLNRGKYNIYYKLKKVKDFPEPALLKSFSADPECGMIAPSLKISSVEFECTPTTKINLNNVPAYTCSLLDSSKNQVVVAKFPVCVTIASFYNTFTLFPLGELNFHIIAVGERVLRDVILNNTSKCPFNYEIILPKEHRDLPPEPLPAQKQPLVKDTKLKVPPLKCGNFLIINDDNLLAPGESKMIPIQFYATAARRFEETIHFVISDTCPAEAEGIPLKLVGTGALPSLDFWNLENTFREHLIVKEIEEYKAKESTPHCVFAEKTVTLHFFCITVNTKHTASIDLYNNGLVSCVLKNILHYQTNTNSEIFSLGPTDHDVHIDPFQHRRVAISFSPKALKEYRAVLEVKVKMLHNETESFNLCLIGEGVIPRVQLLSPPMRQQRLALLQFPVTCLGSINKKKIRFKNISSVKTNVNVRVIQSTEDRPVFGIIESSNPSISENHATLHLRMSLLPNEIYTIQCLFNPLIKGRTSCDIDVRIEDNPYENFTILCEAEAFVEDVILMGLDMVSLEGDFEVLGRSMSQQSGGASDSRKKIKSAGDRTKTKEVKKVHPIGPDGVPMIPAQLKYVLDFGGCELLLPQKRSVIMLNNSEKVYKFIWEEVDNIVVKPAVGYISPGEEKDVEITFFSMTPVSLINEPLTCNLTAINNESLTIDATKGSIWDSRQTVTVFKINPECLHERVEHPIEEHTVHGEVDVLGYIDITIYYSATTEYTKYECNLEEQFRFEDTYIYQKREKQFKLKNIGSVPLKASWKFSLDDEFPARLDKYQAEKQTAFPEPFEVSSKDDSGVTPASMIDSVPVPPEASGRSSKSTLFSGSLGRESVDTWFEVTLPFTIEPNKACLKPGETQVFNITYSPQEAFHFRVCLISTIDNLDPYDQNVSCKIHAKSLVPYVHLDLEKSDYLSRRKPTGIVLPPFIQVLEFKVLGSGCFKKSFQVVNPTSEGYEYYFESVAVQKLDSSKDFVLMHCDKLKGFVEGGTSDTVTFTFAPTEPGIFESQWKLFIPVHDVNIPLLVVGFVREPNVVFNPTILMITNSLLGFTSTNSVNLKNNESEDLTFEYKTHTLYDEEGKIPIVVRPQKGELRGLSEKSITIYYTPISDGPVSFKILFQISHMVKPLTLMVNALSFWVNPKVTYYIIGNEHRLNHEFVTEIHLEQTASTYERRVPFKIKNEGSTTFHYEWNNVVTPVKKYLTVSVEPRSGYVPPGGEHECIMHFHLKTVPVQAYPVTLSIQDGPDYIIHLYALIEKPLYHFNVKDFDFGKCIIGAPDNNYKKNLAFTNDDSVPILIDLETESCLEFFIEYRIDSNIEPRQRAKIPVYFRPRKMEKYEYKLRFWVNSLCEEIITVRGEGVPLLLDLYEGCQKSFDLGPVKVGEKIVREIDVMNYSQVAVNVQFLFKAVYEAGDTDDNVTDATSRCLAPDTPGATGDFAGQSRVKRVKAYRQALVQEQIEKDVENALASVKVIPAKCTIHPHRKMSLKILFRPVGLISKLNVQLNANVLEIIRPLVLLSGSATGMSLRLSQDSLQFGRVRKRGCKVLKLMLENNGDFGARFWWQPLVSSEFSISPLQGHIAAHSNVTFNIRFTPLEYNPFIKVWANCNIENYKSLDLAMYGACVDEEPPQTQSILIECPTREVVTEHINVENPTDDNWLVLSELTGDTSFETLKEFYVPANASFDIPIHFKPKTMGQHEAQVLYAPLGMSALYVNVIGAAIRPNPNGKLKFTIEAKKTLTVPLGCKNIGENLETWLVRTELTSIIPDHFDGYYEIKYPDKVKVWGEAEATCKWTYVCFEPCEMYLRVVFLHEETKEFQFYDIHVVVTPSKIVGTLKFSCRARESVQQELTVTNPLGQETEFTINCSKLKCEEVVKIGRYSEAKVTMTYSPLVVGEFEDYLVVENYLAGAYTYRVEVVCKPAKEKNIELCTPLGTRIPYRFRVVNKTDSVANFITNVDHPSIIAEKDYYVDDNEKGKLLCWFEPTEVGVQNIRVSFNSSTAGEFVFNVKGIATEPLPQGPYEIEPGGFTAIQFKNVFQETTVFRVFVDREEFYVKTEKEKIQSKKEIRVVVYLRERPVGGWGPHPPTGCLTIDIVEPARPKLHWTYFLQALP